MGLPDPDVLLANAIRFLIAEQQHEAAANLLACTIHLDSFEDWGDECVVVWLTGPKHTYDLLMGGEYERLAVRDQLKKAFEVFMPSDLVLKRVSAKIELSAVDPDWRTEMAELLKGRKIDNQGVTFESSIPIKEWMNLRFRSQSEVRVAEALDRAGVLFLPNCRARLGQASARLNREADFLVCAEGRWGILEVDGEPFHPPSRTVHDHERDRLFRLHGVRVAEHFDAEKCRNDPDAVVRTFLDLLRKT